MRGTNRGQDRVMKSFRIWRRTSGRIGKQIAWLARVNAVVRNGKGDPMSVRVLPRPHGLLAASPALAEPLNAEPRAVSSSARRSPTAASTAPRRRPHPERRLGHRHHPGQRQRAGAASCSCRPGHAAGQRRGGLRVACKGMPFEPCFNLDRTDEQELPRPVSRAWASPIAISPAGVRRVASLSLRSRRRRCRSSAPGAGCRRELSSVRSDIP